MADLHDICFGNGVFARSGAPEPSLLPLLARMVHDWDVDRVLHITMRYGIHGGVMPPWFPLWEAVVALIPGGGPRETIDELGAQDIPFSRQAHALPTMPEPQRGALADELAEQVVGNGGPPWFIALAVSRIAPFCTRPHDWPHDGDPVWDALIDRLAEAPWPEEPHGDVLRAHPFAEELLAVEGRHETTGMAATAIDDQWGGNVAAAAPQMAEPEMPGAEMPGAEMPGAAPPPLEMPPPPPPPPAPAPAPAMAVPDDGDFAAFDEATATAESGDMGVDEIRPGGGSGSGFGVGRGSGTGEGTATAEQGRRLQADVYAGDTAVTRAFVAGARHTVDISIGRQATIHADAVMREPVFAEGVDRLPLVVRFWQGEDVQEQTIQLPRNTARDSTVASFTMDVAATARMVTATVIVYDGEQVLQAAVLAGPAVPDLADEPNADGAIALNVQAWVKDTDTVVPSMVAASVVTDGNHALASAGGVAITLDLGALRKEVADLADRIQAGADLLFQGEDELERVMRDLAFHGRRLRASVAGLLPEAVRNASPLQIVSTDPTAFLPLELVYDGPQPTKDSKLCRSWKKALESGECSSCAKAAKKAKQPENPRICPLFFWGLSKIIERHAGLTAPAGAGFEVRSERTGERSELRALTGAVVAASELVAEEDVDAAVEAARQAFGAATEASDWASWIEATPSSPAVLIALPHHAIDSSCDPPIDALELGRALLPAGGIGPTHLGPSDVRPGPVVVLLGCNTGLDDTPIDSFAGEFRMQGASVVVSTLGEVIPRDAAAAVTALVRELAAAATTPGATMGEVILRTRRRLLHDKLVLGLLVVANGDADWRFAAPAVA